MGMLTTKERREAASILAICAIPFGLYGWAVFIATFNHDGVIAPHYDAPGSDWIAFYEAAKSYIQGNLPIIYDGTRFTALQNQTFAHWLLRPLPFHPWIYPPHFLLLLVPFGLLPFGISYAAFVSLSLAGVIWATLCHAPAVDKRLLIASVLLCPASSLTVLAGQNALLIAALLIGGLALLPRRPVAAGVLFGLMTFKPSLGLMLPIALIASGQWRAFAAATATFVILATVSLIVFGAEPWINWLRFFFSTAAADYAQWEESGQLWGISVYACFAAIGASHATASAIQAMAIVLAGSAVYLAFSRPLASDLRLMILCAATILAAPHVSPYDTAALGIAATLYGLRMIQEGSTAVAPKLALMLWLAALLGPPRASPVALIMPLLLAGVIGLIFWQSRSFAREHHGTASG
jgi:alpha-1,2-mannosyltransferase